MRGNGEFTTHEESRSLTKMHGPLVNERVGSAEVVQVILLKQCSNLLSQIVRGMSIREPLFNRLVEVIGRELFYFQSTGGEERQERADREGACMEGSRSCSKWF